MKNKEKLLYQNIIKLWKKDSTPRRMWCDRRVDTVIAVGTSKPTRLRNVVLEFFLKKLVLCLINYYLIIVIEISHWNKQIY